MYKKVFNKDKNAYKCIDISKQNKWLMASLYHKDFTVLLLSVFTGLISAWLHWVVSEQLKFLLSKIKGEAVLLRLSYIVHW